MSQIPNQVFSEVFQKVFLCILIKNSLHFLIYMTCLLSQYISSRCSVQKQKYIVYFSIEVLKQMLQKFKKSLLVFSIAPSRWVGVVKRWIHPLVQNPLRTTSNKEIFLQDYLEVLKRFLQNFYKFLKTCFLCSQLVK